jgi:hypothetical protein
MAAKKHHTEIRYWVKKTAVIKHDRNIKIPSRCVLLMPEIKSGEIVTIR